MSRRTKTIRGVTIPSATTTQTYVCPDRHVHLLGLDDDGDPLCEIVVGQELFSRILEAAEKAGLT